MLSLDAGEGRVIYASSFSKTVCPGIRVGFLVGAAEVIAAIVVRGDQHLHLTEHGGRRDRLRVRDSGAIDRSIERVRGALEQRVDALAGARERASRRQVRQARRRLLPLGRATGGIEPAALLKAAAERKLALVSGDDFVLDGGSGAVRLAFSGVTPEEIREGVTRLAAAVATL